VSSDDAQYEQGVGAFRLCPRAGQKEEFEFAPVCDAVAETEDIYGSAISNRLPVPF
jgi:hypothetical protein